MRQADARTMEALLPRRRGSRKLEELRDGQALTIQASASECEDLLSQLVDYKGTILKWMTEHEALMKKLNDIINHHKKVHQMLEKEKTSLDELYVEGQRKQEQLKAAVETLNASKTPQETATSIDNADEYQDEAENWTQRCLKQFPDVQTIRRSIKVSALSLSIHD